jgi:hypothetical protein
LQDTYKMTVLKDKIIIEKEWLNEYISKRNSR